MIVLRRPPKKSTEPIATAPKRQASSKNASAQMRVTRTGSFSVRSCASQQCDLSASTLLLAQCSAPAHLLERAGALAIPVTAGGAAQGMVKRRAPEPDVTWLPGCAVHRVGSAAGRRPVLSSDPCNRTLSKQLIQKVMCAAQSHSFVMMRSRAPTTAAVYGHPRNAGRKCEGEAATIAAGMGPQLSGSFRATETG